MPPSALSKISYFGGFVLLAKMVITEKSLYELPTRINLSVVIPTYNEKKNIPELITRVREALFLTNFELVIVDDNSPDGTASLVEQLNKKHRNLCLVKRRGKNGLSSAVLTGFRRIFNADAEVFAVMDADMQHPPELLSTMYDKIQEGYDLVVASRYTKEAL